MYPTFNEKTQLIGSYYSSSKKQALRFFWSPIQGQESTPSTLSQRQDSEDSRRQQQQQRQRQQRQQRIKQKQQIKQQQQRTFK